MTIYVLHAVTTNLVKIGYTAEDNPLRRLGTLQTGCPHRLRVLTYVPGAPRSLERDLHLQFRQKRNVLAGREWFDLDETERDELVLQIGRPDIPRVDPDFYSRACTPDSEYGLVIFGPHTPFAGYLGSYDDDEPDFCPEHDIFGTLDADNEDFAALFEQSLALALTCSDCVAEGACVDNGYGHGSCFVIVPHHDIRPATLDEIALRPFFDLARVR